MYLLTFSVVGRFPLLFQRNETAHGRDTSSPHERAEGNRKNIVPLLTRINEVFSLKITFIDAKALVFLSDELVNGVEENGSLF